MKQFRKSAVIVYCVMVFHFWISNYTFMSYLSSYGYTLTSSAALVGIMLGSYGWMQVILRIPVGILSDRLNNRLFYIRLGCFMCLLAALVMYFAPNIYWMIIGRTLSGISVCVWAPMTVMFTTYYDDDQSAKAMSMVNGCYYAGALFASIIAIPIVKALGIRGAFLASAATGMVAIVVSLFLKEQPSERRATNVRDLIRVGCTGWVLALGIIGAIVQIMSFSASSGFTPQLALALGQRESTIAVIQLVSMGSSFIFTLLTPKLFINRIGARNSLIIMLCVQAVATLVQPLMPSIPLLYAAIVVEGIARGVNCSLLLCLVVIPFDYEEQSAAMGFYQGIYSIGIMLGPMIAGWIIEISSIAASFFVIGGLGIIAAIIGVFCVHEE